MKRLPLLIGLIALVPLAGEGSARPRHREQDAAFEGTRDGRIMPLRSIESRVVPQMRGAEYLGPELDPSTGRYRLKFMRGPHVIWVDVDGRTGEIIAKSGD